MAGDSGTNVPVSVEVKCLAHRAFEQQPGQECCGCGQCGKDWLSICIKAPRLGAVRAEQRLMSGRFSVEPIFLAREFATTIALGRVLQKVEAD